jgi:hypothetical protein
MLTTKMVVIEIIRTKNDAPIYLAELNIHRAITRGYRGSVADSKESKQEEYQLKT